MTNDLATDFHVLNGLNGLKNRKNFKNKGNKKELFLSVNPRLRFF
jgi:hypothetical protein